MKSDFPSFTVRNLALAFVALTLFGCGGKGYRLTDVSGTITLDGKPLPNASVTFIPVGDGVGPASTAITDESGNFQLRTIDLDLSGATLGDHRVTVTTARASSADEMAKISKELVPPKYRDGSFRLTVKADSPNAVNIEMLSKSK